jgi:ribonuclease P protein component
MDAPCWRGGVPKADTNSRLATRELSGTPINFGFPKSARILKSADFRTVYKEGTRFANPYFAAFCLRGVRQQGGPRLGFTVPRAFGKAVARNRVKRRLREALRVRLPEIGAQWDIVINPRRLALSATPEELRRAVDRLVAQCGKQ